MTETVDNEIDDSCRPKIRMDCLQLVSYLRPVICVKHCYGDRRHGITRQICIESLQSRSV